MSFELLKLLLNLIDFGMEFNFVLLVTVLIISLFEFHRLSETD